MISLRLLVKPEMAKKEWTKEVFFCFNQINHKNCRHLFKMTAVYIFMVLSLVVHLIGSESPAAFFEHDIAFKIVYPVIQDYEAVVYEFIGMHMAEEPFVEGQRIGEIL